MTSGINQTHKEDLIQQAINKYTNIFPVTNNLSISADESFTIFDNAGNVIIIFWFNTKDNSTHVVQKELNN